MGGPSGPCCLPNRLVRAGGGHLSSGSRPPARRRRPRERSPVRRPLDGVSDHPVAMCRPPVASSSGEGIHLLTGSQRTVIQRAVGSKDVPLCGDLVTRGDGPAPRTRAQQKAQTRERLLAAAWELFGENDFGAVTVSDIAARRGRPWTGVPPLRVEGGHLPRGARRRRGGDGLGVRRRSVRRSARRDPSGPTGPPRLHRRPSGPAIRLITGATSVDPAIRARPQVGRDRVLSGCSRITWGRPR